MAAISQTTFWNAFSWMKNFVFWFEFHWSLFVRVQLTIFQHWFRWWLGADQATSHYPNQCWPSSLTHICGTRGRWVNTLRQREHPRFCRQYFKRILLNENRFFVSNCTEAYTWESMSHKVVTSSDNVMALHRCITWNPRWSSSLTHICVTPPHCVKSMFTVAYNNPGFFSQRTVLIKNHLYIHVYFLIDVTSIQHYKHIKWHQQKTPAPTGLIDHTGRVGSRW